MQNGLHIVRRTKATNRLEVYVVLFLLSPIQIITLLRKDAYTYIYTYIYIYHIMDEADKSVLRSMLRKCKDNTSSAFSLILYMNAYLDIT